MRNIATQSLIRSLWESPGDVIWDVTPPLCSSMSPQVTVAESYDDLSQKSRRWSGRVSDEAFPAETSAADRPRDVFRLPASAFLWSATTIRAFGSSLSGVAIQVLIVTRPASHPR